MDREGAGIVSHSASNRGRTPTREPPEYGIVLLGHRLGHRHRRQPHDAPFRHRCTSPPRAGGSDSRPVGACGAAGRTWLWINVVCGITKLQVARYALNSVVTSLPRMPQVVADVSLTWQKWRCLGETSRGADPSCVAAAGWVVCAASGRIGELEDCSNRCLSLKWSVHRFLGGVKVGREWTKIAMGDAAVTGSCGHRHSTHSISPSWDKCYSRDRSGSS